MVKYAYQLYICISIDSLTQVSNQLASRIGGGGGHFFLARLGSLSQVPWGLWHYPWAPIPLGCPILEVLLAWQAGLMAWLQVGQALRCSSYLGLGSAVSAPTFLGTQPLCVMKVSSRGCGLSMRPSLLGINECMVWDRKSGPLVLVSRDWFLLHLRNYIPTDMESLFPSKVACNVVCGW